MGKPRMIILVRHAQSEGNKNRDIHQYIPDHRVQLTPEGHSQAEEAGRRLRSLLRPDDTLLFFTSPYRRTRETTEGMLKTLTSDEPTPSPWKRSTITVYEEPRLREQDFGNFQPCSAEMERMWQERADYGHFFYRIPNGESAADAYDRVSGFNESLWRSFSDENFPSVCVVVTHGLMTRVFLMKWYHWSVEYFEDLRNVNHCEFITMKQHPENGKYVLENELRTWSDLKRRAAASATVATVSTSHRANPLNAPTTSPAAPARRWGGCVNGCDHARINFPRRTKRMNTFDFTNGAGLLNANGKSDTSDLCIHLPDSDKCITLPSDRDQDRNKPATAQAITTTTLAVSTSTTLNPPHPSPFSQISTATNDTTDSLVTSPTSHSGGDGDVSSSDDEGTHSPHTQPHPLANRGRDFGGSLSGVATPAEGFSDDSDYVDPSSSNGVAAGQSVPGFFPIRQKSLASASAAAARSRPKPSRKMSHAEWEEKSGMGLGRRADTLGDGAPEEEDSEKELKSEEGSIVSRVVDGMKESSRKSYDEIY